MLLNDGIDSTLVSAAAIACARLAARRLGRFATFARARLRTAAGLLGQLGRTSSLLRSTRCITDVGNCRPLDRSFLDAIVEVRTRTTPADVDGMPVDVGGVGGKRTAQ